MEITKKFLDSAGRRSPMARKAMGQAGRRIPLRGLKRLLVSLGACELTRRDVAELGATVYEKRFSFTPAPLIYVLLEPEEFHVFRRIADTVDLEAARIRHGVIGILRRAEPGC